jgi:hypothetical protein
MTQPWWNDPGRREELAAQAEQTGNGGVGPVQDLVRNMGTEDGLHGETERLRGLQPGLWNRDSTLDAMGHRMYGGSREAAEAEIRRMGTAADAAVNRGGYLFNDQQYNQAQANAAEARGQQQQGLDMLRYQMGNGPTEATRAMAASAERNAGLQTSLAGLARGGAVGQMAARDQMQLGNAQAGQQAAQQAGILRAQEQEQAALQYGQQAGAMRAGDDAMRGVAQGYSNAQHGARMGMDELNASRQRGYEALRGNVYGQNQAAAQGAMGLEQARRGMEDGDTAAQYAGDQRRKAAYFAMGAGALQTWSDASRGNNQGKSAGDAARDNTTKDDEPVKDWRGVY